MSDDLLPVDGCVRLDDARRVAAGRTLVNLDAVDFAPILAALKRAVGSARQIAEWKADGWIGAAGHELLSQLAKRWTVLESALAAAGLTENAAWIFDDERLAAEERNTAAFVLQDMLRDLRTGKYGPEGKFDHATLVKRLTLAAEMVQALTPSEPPRVESMATPTAAQHPALTDEDRYILTVLEAHRGKPLTYARILTESVRMEREDRTQIRRLSDSTIRTRVRVLLIHQLVARPPGTTKKGIAITAKGSQALAFAQTQRKPNGKSDTPSGLIESWKRLDLLCCRSGRWLACLA